MAIDPAAELPSGLDVEEIVALARKDGDKPITGVAPSRLALRRLRRNRGALAFGALFVLLVAMCLAAPLYAKHIAHTDAYENHLTETIKLHGKVTDVVSDSGVAIGPTWHGRFFLGADESGRDIAVRLLYGGRTSLEIGFAAAAITILLGIVFGILAGYLGGWVDMVISRVMDVIWPFPTVLLGVALGTALAVGGLKIGPLEVSGSSLLIPILIIGVIPSPYMARPLRGQVLALREKEFVEAARAQGLGPLRIMFSEILPNLSSTIIVFAPLMVANAILLEAGLSYLGAGVQAPTPSWGTMISVGVDHMVTGPHQAIVPGAMLVLTVLALNIFGDGVRDAFDPRAKVRTVK
jgi:peptide/nickel transport system permease protein